MEDTYNSNQQPPQWKISTPPVNNDIPSGRYLQCSAVNNYSITTSQGWVKIHILGSNITQPNQIQIHCFSRFQFKYKCSIQIQIHSHFWFKYDSNTFPFLKFDSNMIQIHGLFYHYISSVSQWVEFCLTRHTTSKLWQNWFPRRLKRIIWWKVISSKGNHVGRHYVWSWNRNVDTDNVFEKVLESIKYFTNVIM